MRLADIVQASTRVPLLQVAKTAVAAVASWFLALAVFPEQVPVFASVAALLVVQPSVNQSFGKAIERSLGVLVGVLVALGAALLFGEQSWLVLVAIVLSLFVAWALRLTPGSSVQIPISAMLVLSIGAATPEYAAARVVETIIGALVGLLVNVLIVPPLALAPARLAVLRLGRRIAEELERLAAVLTEPDDRAELDAALESARALRELRQAASDAIRSGRESLTLNPRRTRYRDQLERDVALLDRMEPLVTQVIGMARAVRDHWDASLSEVPASAGIAEELRRAAHDLRLLVEAGTETDDAGPEEPPALTRPLVIAAPPPGHWIVIGALMEDLRRVREEIRGEGRS
ncbi:FUSC family protein [Naasia sp. SYSU D00057]|uniref:FUSC family protein n=1 Tax=Naasia sp. SYSU D00057 TaxID=2817380 RepID=UPI001B313F13|nr:FUSC family protein [Naasia sp. SYSU D00057]